MLFSPLNEEEQNQDLFSNGYLELVYIVQVSLNDSELFQDAIEKGKARVDGKDHVIDDFCYKPITGNPCLITSPMGFWQMDKDRMLADNDVKATAQCIPDGDDEERRCFDRAGVPVQLSAIFGGTTCRKDTTKPCSPCLLDASALITTFLLNNNEYSNPVAIEWELHAMIKSVKSFNHVFGFNDSLPHGLKDYDWDLIEKIKDVYSRFPDMIPIRLDYLSERSIPDELEA